MKKIIVGILSVLMLVTIGIMPTKASETIYDFITFDRGMQGNLWATDYFHSKVTITPSEEGCYEVIREDGGTFAVLDGAMSPGGTGGTLVGNGTQGTISGGITDIVCGDLRPIPLVNNTPEDLRIGGWLSYEDKYFHRYFSEIENGNITKWGWTFKTCNNGTWVDTAETEASYPSAAMGDITGKYVPCFPTNMDQCKKDGWKTFNNPAFKNQGSCVSYVQSNDHAGKRN